MGNFAENLNLGNRVRPPLYGVIKKYVCNERVVHVYYVAIDDLVITTPLKKNDIAALWSCSGKAGASLLGQDVVASLLSLCMAKWLRKWRRGWLYVRSNTKNAKSLLSLHCERMCVWIHCHGNHGEEFGYKASEHTIKEELHLKPKLSMFEI